MKSVSIFQSLTLGSYLSQLLASKQSVNSRYSLRQFSKSLGMSHVGLSHLMKGKRLLSISRAQILAKKLKLSEAESEYLVLMVERESATDSKMKEILTTRLFKLATQSDVQEMSEDHFSVFSEWYYLPLLSLIKYSKETSFTPKRAAEVLELEVSTIRAALEKLAFHKLIVRSENGWIRTRRRLFVNATTSGEVLKQYHLQMLNLTAQKINSGVSSERVLATETFAIDASLRPELNRILNEACDQVVELASRSKRVNSIYHLNVSCVPLIQQIYSEEESHVQSG